MDVSTPPADAPTKTPPAEYSPPSIMVVDKEGRILDLNGRFVRDLRSKGQREDLVGKCIFDYISEEDKDRARRDFESTVDGGSAEGRTYSFIRDDGTEVAAEVSVNILSEGAVALVFGDAKGASGREGEARFHTFFDQAPLGYQSLSADGTILEVNRMWTEMTGYSREEAVGRWFGDFMAPEYSQGFKARFARFIREGRNSSELELIRKDGTRLQVAIEGRVCHCPDGTFKQTHCMLRDVTDQKRAEAELRESVQQMKQLLSFLPDATFVIDRGGRVTAWNRAMEGLTGVRAEDILGRGDHEPALPFYGVRRPILIDLILKPDHAFEAQYSNVKRTGGSISADGMTCLGYMWAVASPLYDTRGNIVGAIESVRNISEMKRVEDELKRHVGHLEELVRERTAQLQESHRLAAIGETATMVGHDLRNPLQAIVNTMFLLERTVEGMPESPESAEMSRSFERIDRNIAYMNKIVSDLTDFARPLALHTARVPVGILIGDTLSNIAVPQCISVEVRADRSLTADLDPLMMRRVLTNLITNSVQAMPTSGCLGISAFGSGGKLVIKVSDTGPGIPPSVVKTLFTPLRSHKSKGMGLGLPVAKRMVEAHGGAITFRTALGYGTTFIVDVPLEQPSSPSQPKLG
jgi:PAS domain S-box-containing protein